MKCLTQPIDGPQCNQLSAGPLLLQAIKSHNSLTRRNIGKCLYEHTLDKQHAAVDTGLSFSPEGDTISRDEPCAEKMLAL
jgi:hypothetical protein